MSSKRLERDRLTALALRLLDEGNYPARVARTLRITRQTLHYHIKRWLNQGFLLKEKADGITFYKLTPDGKKFLTEGELPRVLGRVVRLHEVVVKFAIIRQPVVELDWRKVEMQNWQRLIGVVAGCTVEKTTKHVLIHAEVVRARDPESALVQALNDIYEVKGWLERHTTIGLGPGELSRKPHYGIYAPETRPWTRRFQLSDDVGKLDESEGYAEIDFYSADDAKKYLLMPRLLAEVNRTLDVMQKGQVTLEQLVRKVADTQVLIAASLKKVSELLEQRRKEP